MYKIEVDELYTNRNGDEVKKILEKEGNQKSHQFKEWWDVFELLSYGRRHKLSEIEMHCILSNRFELVRKENENDNEI